MQQLQQGDTLQGGKFRIIRTLGQGGFGITYLAHHQQFDSDVCIKEFFFKDFCNRDEATRQVSIGTESSREMVERFKQKFIKEARTISRLHHTNIVSVIDIFEENGTAYYVMEHIDGRTLSEIVKAEGPLTAAEATTCTQQVGNALSYIHGLAINHLDVKPANIMRRNSDGAYILIDFGLAKQYDAATGNQTSTTPVGISHGYAPIEQYRAGGVSEFSPQTDVYSLGATLYYLLTGIIPPEPAELIGSPLTFPAYVPDHMQNAISRAMQQDKAARPANIAAFCTLLSDAAAAPGSLHAAYNGEETNIHTTDASTSPQGLSTKNKAIIIGIVGALVLGAGAFTLGHFIGKSDTPTVFDDDEYYRGVDSKSCTKDYPKPYEETPARAAYDDYDQYYEGPAPAYSDYDSVLCK